MLEEPWAYPRPATRLLPPPSRRTTEVECALATTEPDEATLTSSMLVSFFIPCFVDPMISTAMAEVKGGWLSRNERKPRTIHLAEVLAGEGR